MHFVLMTRVNPWSQLITATSSSDGLEQRSSISSWCCVVSIEYVWVVKQPLDTKVKKRDDKEHAVAQSMSSPF